MFMQGGGECQFCPNQENEKIGLISNGGKADKCVDYE